MGTVEPSRRIIAHQVGYRWAAWFDGAPETNCLGYTARAAVRRLASRVLGWDSIMLELRDANAETGFIVYEVRPTGTVCPECKGTGQYVGLLLVEPCGVCRGSGRLSGAYQGRQS